MNENKSCIDCVFCKTNIGSGQIVYTCDCEKTLPIIDDLTIAQECEHYDADGWIK